MSVKKNQNYITFSLLPKWRRTAISADGGCLLSCVAECLSAMQPETAAEACLGYLNLHPGTALRFGG